jgi:hypothetical protein
MLFIPASLPYGTASKVSPEYIGVWGSKQINRQGRRYAGPVGLKRIRGRKRSVLLGKGAGALAGRTFFRFTAPFFFKSAFFAFPDGHHSLLSDNIFIYNQFGNDFIRKEISVKQKGQAALSRSAWPFLPVVTSPLPCLRDRIRLPWQS